MSLVCRSGLCILFVWCAGVEAESNKGMTDRWFAKDKFVHFAVSAFYSGGTTLIAHRHFEQGKRRSPVIGFTLTLSLGAGKEIADSETRRGTASFKDFIWDFAGALTGALAVGLSL